MPYITCKECDAQIESHKFTFHLRLHKMKRVDYILKHDYDGSRPLCACGCGADVKWHKGSFRKFVHGHANRDLNIRQRMIDAGRQAAADPEKREKNSRAVKEKWKDPEYVRNIMTREPARIAALRPMWKSDEFAERCSVSRIALWQTEWGTSQRELMSRDEFREAVSIGTKKGLADPAIRQRLSEQAAEMMASGVTSPNRGKREWIHNPFTGQDELMHSSWETMFLKRCIDIDFPVTKKHDLRVKYIAEDKQERTYVPDFVSLDGSLVVEIKGHMTERDRTKILKMRSLSSVENSVFIVLDNVSDINTFERPS